jgi:hypothetical protein
MSGTWQPTSETKTTLALLSQAIVKDLSDEERRELNKAIQELSAERAAKRSPLVELVAHMIIEAVDYHFKKAAEDEKERSKE